MQLHVFYFGGVHMKKATVILIYALFALLALLPGGMLICACFGYTFELISFSAYSVILALLSICTMVFCFCAKQSVENRAAEVLAAIISPLSMVCAVVSIFHCQSVLTIATSFIYLGCCFIITLLGGRPPVLKIIDLILSALVALPVGFLLFLVLIFGNFGQNTVVQTVESPNGQYYAQVIDSDQGGLGGDTLVDVYENKGIDLIVLKIRKKPQRVYRGDWGEFKNMEIYWKDDTCLVIDSVEYEIGK